MTTSVPEAGSAAPAPAAVQLLHYKPRDFVGNELSLRTAADSIPGHKDAQICLSADGHMVSFCCWMTPALARQLAVYLVDCANALDNPAQRVIVDEAHGEPPAECTACGDSGKRGGCSWCGEGIGHE